MNLKAIVLAAVLATFLIHSSLAQSPIASTGSGATPFALAQDYRALRWNPAALSFNFKSQDIRTAAGSFEGGASLRSTMFDRSDLWDDLLNRSGSDENWSNLNSTEWIDRIKGENIELNADVIVAGSYRKAKRWGFAYVHRQSFNADVLLSEATASLLFEGGASSLFDFVVLASNDTIANDGSWDMETLAQVVQGFGSNALLSNVLDESRLTFNYSKSHEIGVSRMWGGEDDNWQLHTGIGGRLILGNGHFHVGKDENGNLDAFGAFSNGFQIPALDTVAATIADPTINRLRNWGPVGQGWGVDIGAMLTLGRHMWASAAVTDIGWIEWRGEKYFVEDVTLDSWTQTANAPSQWIDAVTSAMNPSTWFDGGVAETRRINLPTALHIGGGMKLGKALTVAADATFANPEQIQSEGMRAGASAVLQLLPWVRIDAGLRKWQEETVRVPIGIVVGNPKGGWEGGLQMSDAQGLWRKSSPELGMNFCFLRWVWMSE